MRNTKEILFFMRNLSLIKMGRNKHLSPTKRARIVTLFKDAKLLKSEISKHENIPRQTVQDTITKFEATRSYRDAPRSGRPTKLSKLDRRRILRMVEQNRCLSSSEIRDQLDIGRNVSIHASAIRRF